MAGCQVHEPVELPVTDQRSHQFVAEGHHVRWQAQKVMLLKGQRLGMVARLLVAVGGLQLKGGAWLARQRLWQAHRWSTMVDLCCCGHEARRPAPAWSEA